MSRAPILFLLFFVSGFCALLYQIVWLRMAFASFGVITPVLSVLISVFMLGLSLGAWLGGKWITAWTSRTGRSAILFYGVAELGVGLGAFLVPLLFQWGEVALRPAGEINSTAYLLISALTITLAILPWCFFMGTTFPFMTAYIKEYNQKSETSFSYLYLANVVGAMCGVGLTAVVLIETWGFSKTLLLAGLLNFGIAGLSFLLAGLLRRPREITSVQDGVPDELTTTGLAGELSLGSRTALTVLFGTGFVSMAMEVVWTRTYTPILTTTIYAFAGLLAVYLFATWVGTAIHRGLLRLGRPIGNDAILAFLAVTALLPILLPDPNVKPEKWVALASIFPFCAGLGYLTPKLIDEYSRGRPQSVGRAYAWNILGSILGPLFAGYLFLPKLGAKWSLVFLAAPMLWFLVLAIRATRIRPVSVVFGVLSLALLVYVSVESTTYEDGSLYPKSVVRRDHTATVISTDNGKRQRLLVNGVGITHKTPITKMMAHLPMAFHTAEPTNSLVICFGMGTTMRSLASWGGHVTAVELVPSVADAFGYYYDDAEEYRNDPAVEIVIDDGRRFLKRTSQLFDVVTIDPPPPVETAGSSLLYSYEFYELLKTRMAEGSVLQQWLPQGDRAILEGATGALAKAFAHVRIFKSFEGWGFHFLASQHPLPDRAAADLHARLPQDAKNDLAEWVHPSRVPELFRATLGYEVPITSILPGGPTSWISDDRPINEYYLLRRRQASR